MIMVSDFHRLGLRETRSRLIAEQTETMVERWFSGIVDPDTDILTGDAQYDSTPWHLRVDYSVLALRAVAIANLKERMGHAR